jgi:predicted Ser/Thr protein kinase
MPYVESAKLSDFNILKEGEYGLVYQAQWDDQFVVVKKSRGEHAVKNACREFGQVQLGCGSSYVVPANCHVQ